MRDNIYDYLRNYGFTKEDINNFENNNRDIFAVVLKDVEENIVFLETKGLTKEEIISICNNSPYMITIANNRREYFDNIYYNVLNLTKEELISIIKNNNNAYIESPKKLERIINSLKETLSIDKIKTIIIENPNIISMPEEDAIKFYKEV